MFGDDSRFYGWVWHFHDISYKKQIEDEIRTVNQSLEERVRERTSELQRVIEQLHETNEQLKAAEEKLLIQDDITKGAYDALEKSEKRFRIVTQSVSDVIWDWDLKKNKLDWYGRIDTMLGYDPEDFPLSIDAWENIIHLEDLDWVLTELDRHINAHTPHETEYRVINKDGKNRYWVDRGTAMYDEKGRAFLCLEQKVSHTNNPILFCFFLHLLKFPYNMSIAISMTTGIFVIRIPEIMHCYSKIMRQYSKRFNSLMPTTSKYPE